MKGSGVLHSIRALSRTLFRISFRRVSLQVKLSAAFLAMTLLLFLIVNVLINVLLERQFGEYVKLRQTQAMTDAVSLIAERGRDAMGNWDVTGLDTIGANLLGEGFILKITDAEELPVWDANDHNSGRCAEILEHMAHNMAIQTPGMDGAYAEQSFPLEDGADVTIGYYGPWFYSDYDIRFLAGLNRLLFWSAVVSSLGALGFGIFMARRITHPLRRIMHASRRIADGNYRDRLQPGTTTSEIVDLAETVNHLAESLLTQERLRSRLTADVAHELRTPLSTLVSHLEAMIDGIWKPDVQRLSSCHEEAVRLTGLVEDLGRLTAAESGAAELRLDTVDLGALLSRMVTSMEEAFRQKGVAIVLEGAGFEENASGRSGPAILADADKLSQVFVNLLSNALKYTPSGGTVTVTVGRDPMKDGVSIRDTGIGIAAEELPLIFERFYRTDVSRSRMTGGSGIGLAIARAIMDAHRGTITAESSPGEGSCFTVRLPSGRIED